MVEEGNTSCIKGGELSVRGNVRGIYPGEKCPDPIAMLNAV